MVVVAVVAFVVLGFISNNCTGKVFFEVLISFIPLKLPSQLVRALLESREFANCYSPSRWKKRNGNCLLANQLSEFQIE